MNFAKSKINRTWRPEDDGGGDQGGQPSPPQDASPQDQGQQGQQAGPGQPGGSGGSGGGEQPGGQPGGPSGPRKSPPVTMEQAQKAAKKRQAAQRKAAQQLQDHADYEGIDRKDLEAQVNAARKDKGDWLTQFFNRMRNKDHQQAMKIFYGKKGEQKLENVEMGNNPVDNAERYFRKMREITKRDRPDRDFNGWGNRHDRPMSGDDRPANARDLHFSKLYDSTLNKNRTESVFDAASGMSIRKLNASFSVLASKIAEDAVSWPTIGDDVWDVHALMKRRYDHRPLPHCKQAREKSRLVLVLDTSGSCNRYSQFFQSIAQAALAFGDVEIYEAPNAFITHKLIPGEGWLSVSSEGSSNWGLQNRHIVFFGDWDGAGNIIHNSQKNKLYWFDCDQHFAMSQTDRENYEGQFGYTYGHFKGRRYACFAPRDFIRLVKKIK